MLALSIAALFGVASCTSGGATYDAGSDALDAGGHTDAATELPIDAVDSSLIAWDACGLMQCASVIVPRDEEDPDGGTVTLALIRSRARMRAQRIGVLFVNFGGPGESSVGPLRDGVPPMLAGGVTTIVDRFDVIGIDWRGVGVTSPTIHCFDSALATAWLDGPTVPRGDAQWSDLASLGHRTRDGCVSNNDATLLRHVATVDAARDMDRVRALLGEDRINFLGFSYGSYLGAMYATLFPSRVRAFALDSPVIVPPDRRDRWRAMAPAFDDVLWQFFTWCAQTTRCYFGPSVGRDASSVAAAFDTLASRLDATPLATSTRPLDGGGVRLAAAASMYSPSRQWLALGTALAQADSGDGDALRLMVDAVLAPSTDPGADNAASSGLAISALDSPLPPDVDDAALRSFLEGEIVPIAPRAGSALAINELAPFVAWPFVHAPPIPPISSPTAPPFLLTATLHDIVPYAWASSLRASLANGSYVVTYEGSGHANAAYSPCLGQKVVAFLVDPTQAPTPTTCENLPF